MSDPVPYLMQQPNAIEQQFAAAIDPGAAPAYLMGAMLQRRAATDAYNRSAGEAFAASNELENAKSQRNYITGLVQALAPQKAGMPHALDLIGRDPSTGMAALQGQLSQDQADAVGKYGGGIKNLREAGYSTDPSAFSTFGITPTTQVNPLDIDVANIGANARVTAARLGERSGGGLGKTVDYEQIKTPDGRNIWRRIERPGVVNEDNPESELESVLSGGTTTSTGQIENLAPEDRDIVMRQGDRAAAYLTATYGRKFTTTGATIETTSDGRKVMTLIDENGKPAKIQVQ